MFENDPGINKEQTVRAAGAYSKIITTVEEARLAATKAVEAAMKALQKASPASGNLRTKADQVIFEPINWFFIKFLLYLFLSCRKLFSKGTYIERKELHQPKSSPQSVWLGDLWDLRQLFKALGNN